VWGLILAASVTAIGAMIGSAFTSGTSLTTSPASTQAEEVLADNFSQSAAGGSPPVAAPASAGVPT
jgi:hypothetical protein